MYQENSLIGRLKERTELFKEIDDSLAGRGYAVFISGESGVGKTRLIEEVLGKCGVPVFSARSNDDGGSSYDLFRNLIRDILRHPLHNLNNKKPLPSQLSVILPELGEVPAEPASEEIHNAIISLLLDPVHHSSILFFDDVQWADNASLEILQKLIEKISSQPIAIIVVYRSDEITPDHKIRKLRNHLRRSRKIKEIELKALDFFETKQLVENILDGTVTDSLAEKIYLQTQGLPLFTEEIVNTLLEENFLVQGSAGFELSGKRDSCP
jgi:predicted ATPase